MKKLLYISEFIEQLSYRIAEFSFLTLQLLTYIWTHIFIYCLLSKCTTYIQFYLVSCPQIKMSVSSVTIVAMALRFSLPVLYFPFTGQNSEFEKLKIFSMTRSLGFISVWQPCQNQLYPSTKSQIYWCSRKGSTFPPHHCHQGIIDSQLLLPLLQLGYDCLALPPLKIHLFFSVTKYTKINLCLFFWQS